MSEKQRIPIYIHGSMDVLYWIEESDLGVNILDPNEHPLILLSHRGARFTAYWLNELSDPTRDLGHPRCKRGGG